MSPKLQPVRGTHDILPEESLKREHLVSILNYVASLYGYHEMATPIFEFSEVFHRTLGETSDVVNKETYTFTDRGGESITLRPELTASVVRSFISNGLQDKLPFKVHYHGPAFRYERPQKGRMRQFHQFGIEYLGEAGVTADIEVIALAMHAMTALGLKDKVTLEINSLGDIESRTAYREALVAYFNGHKLHLSEDSKMRLEKNPLRILDSKDEGDRKIVGGAPAAVHYFTQASKDFFEQIKEALAALNIPYVVNPRLVRGLDYYSHTVFEITTELLGAQGTVLAGGRYDGLVKMMGGHDTPGIGFASGIERLLALMDADGYEWPKPLPCIAVIPVDENYTLEALKLAQDLRKSGFAAELVGGGNMSKKMKKADKMGAFAVIMLGESEVKEHKVSVKHMADGTQHTVPRSEILRHIAELVNRIFKS